MRRPTLTLATVCLTAAATLSTAYAEPQRTETDTIQRRHVIEASRTTGVGECLWHDAGNYHTDIAGEAGMWTIPKIVTQTGVNYTVLVPAWFKIFADERIVPGTRIERFTEPNVEDIEYIEPLVSESARDATKPDCEKRRAFLKSMLKP